MLQKHKLVVDLLNCSLPEIYESEAYLFGVLSKVCLGEYDTQLEQFALRFLKSTDTEHQDYKPFVRALIQHDYKVACYELIAYLKGTKSGSPEICIPYISEVLLVLKPLSEKANDRSYWIEGLEYAASVNHSVLM